MTKLRKLFLLASSAALALGACLEDEVPPPARTPQVFFIAPSPGEQVGPDFHVELGVTDLTLRPAGTVAAGTGHLVLFVDEPCATAGETIAAAPSRVRLRGGEAELDLSLDLGAHRLCAQVADGAGVALTAAQSIAIEVVEVRVQFVSPQYGAALGQRVLFELASAGVVIEPSGAARPGAAHYYLALDVAPPAEGASIVGAAGVVNLSGGESAVELPFAHGPHEVWLGLADGDDVALAPRTRVAFFSY